jgi:hypothetical protein
MWLESGTFRDKCVHLVEHPQLCGGQFDCGGVRLKQRCSLLGISIDTSRIGMRAVLEVLITKQSPTKWEWRVCDRQGATIMNGFESTRLAAKYRGYRALFQLLAFGWDR